MRRDSAGLLRSPSRVAELSDTGGLLGLDIGGTLAKMVLFVPDDMANTLKAAADYMVTVRPAAFDERIVTINLVNCLAPVLRVATEIFGRVSNIVNCKQGGSILGFVVGGSGDGTRAAMQLKTCRSCCRTRGVVLNALKSLLLCQFFKGQDPPISTTRFHRDESLNFVIPRRGTFYFTR